MRNFKLFCLAMMTGLLLLCQSGVTASVCKKDGFYYSALSNSRPSCLIVLNNETIKNPVVTVSVNVAVDYTIVQSILVKDNVFLKPTNTIEIVNTMTTRLDERIWQRSLNTKPKTENYHSRLPRDAIRC